MPNGRTSQLAENERTLDDVETVSATNRNIDMPEENEISNSEV